MFLKYKPCCILPVYLGQFGFKLPHGENISIDLIVGGTRIQVVSHGFSRSSDVIGVCCHHAWITAWIYERRSWQDQRTLVNLLNT